MEESFSLTGWEVVVLVTTEPAPVLLQLQSGALQLVLLHLTTTDCCTDVVPAVPHTHLELMLERSINSLQVFVISPQLFRLPSLRLSFNQRLTKLFSLFNFLKVFPKI